MFAPLGTFSMKFPIRMPRPLQRMVLTSLACMVTITLFLLFSYFWHLFTQLSWSPEKMSLTALSHFSGEIENPPAALASKNYYVLSTKKTLTPPSFNTTIALGCAITSKGQGIAFENLQILYGEISGLPYLSIFLPCFCKTASAGYSYHMYLAYDADDVLFGNDTGRRRFSMHFWEEVTRECSTRGVVIESLNFVRCPYSGNPAWSQNDAMMAAYLDHRDYYYRVNDDVRFNTKDWTSEMINMLQSFSVPHVGVVGPSHSGDNGDIMTFDFVHRTHIDIFGFYYPRTFKHWYADWWITLVYPSNMCTKNLNVVVRHSASFVGTRYKIQLEHEFIKKPRLKVDKITFNSYMESLPLRTMDNNLEVTVNKSNIFALVCYSTTSQPCEYEGCLGAVRNAVLLQRFLPSWRVSVYIPALFWSDAGHKKCRFSFDSILKKLEILGANVVQYSTSGQYETGRSYNHMTRLVARPSTWRLTEAEATLIKEWTESQFASLTIRDAPSKIVSTIVPDLHGVTLQDFSYENIHKTVLDLAACSRTFCAAKIHANTLCYIHESRLSNSSDIQCAKVKTLQNLQGRLDSQSKKQSYMSQCFDVNEDPCSKKNKAAMLRLASVINLVENYIGVPPANKVNGGMNVRATRPLVEYTTSSQLLSTIDETLWTVVGHYKNRTVTKPLLDEGWLLRGWAFDPLPGEEKPFADDPEKS